MTREGFKAWLRPYVERKEPFVAYLHAHGYGMLRTGTVLVDRPEYILSLPDGGTKVYRDYGAALRRQKKDGGRIAEGLRKGVKYTVPGQKAARWKKELEALRRRAYDLIVVEFDGEKIVNEEGGTELWS